MKFVMNERKRKADIAKPVKHDGEQAFVLSSMDDSRPLIKLNTYRWIKDKYLQRKTIFQASLTVRTETD